jgi:hypothetical protein
MDRYINKFCKESCDIDYICVCPIFYYITQMKYSYETCKVYKRNCEIAKQNKEKV